jgi:hypothetical protein
MLAKEFVSDGRVIGCGVPQEQPIFMLNVRLTYVK